ncbi:helix-turn-helix transcriptional regulator [Agathobaculum sp. NTUH-O15-33]|uniref:helix-turn-helix domain-containing protein n=1 Tax=Agathobaculum sp. NTUH-O15-33 TaxID=3079302 RepID=UPI0029587B58|nr:helix-turn-helix transcriptional regulator [Agathobaculum sp. NTUH-O15-33]WNX84154.1 helix-turn-helix transcriptional regulator [Agathobaculum sp. NTUH-O15-33]
MNEQKIKQDSIKIGANIRRIRCENGLKQTDLVRELDLAGIPITREALVKIESGKQHLTATQFRGICKALNTTYDELLYQDDMHSEK